MKKSRASIMLCAGTGCIATGTLKVRDALQEEITKRGLDEEIKIVMTGCNGYCAEGPVTAVYPDEIFYQNITTEEVVLYFNQQSGMNLTPIFNQYLRRKAQ